MFYRDLFATLCFISFGLALATQKTQPGLSIYFFFGALMCGAMSTTAKRKRWEDPWWAGKIYDWAEAKFEDVGDKLRGPKREFKDNEKIKPLPPLDDK